MASVNVGVRETAPPVTGGEVSLGWGVAAWMERWLRSPHDPSQPLRLTPEQIAFLVNWYSVDGSGRWRWRRGILRRPKGWGKDPLAAMIALAEMCGPVRMAGWDGGKPHGRPTGRPLVNVGAVAEAQTRTTISLIEDLLSPDLAEKHSFDVGVKITRCKIDGRTAELFPVTSSAATAEGARVTAFISNESQHWTRSTGGHDMAAVIRRNLAKSHGGEARELSITNAHRHGQDSTAERDQAAWDSQQSLPPAGRDILLDTREPIIPGEFVREDSPANRAAIAAAYGLGGGNAWWIDVDRIVAEMLDPATPEYDAKRFYLNLIGTGSGSWLDVSALDACRSAGELPDEGAPITVGFDGSRTEDSTAIVATCWETGHQWVAGLWERDWEVDDWRVPEGEVRDTMDRIFGTWDVARAYADPAWWEAPVADWCGQWDSFAAWHFTSETSVRTAGAVTAYRGAILRGEMSWGGPSADRFKAHMLNCEERQVQGVRSDFGRLHHIAKKSRASRDVIDIATAAVLSWQARLDARADGWAPKSAFRVYRDPRRA